MATVGFNEKSVLHLVVVVVSSFRCQFKPDPLYVLQSDTIFSYNFLNLKL